MVNTRTQDGTIATKSYSPTASTFQFPMTPPASPTQVRKPRTPAKIKTDVQEQVSSPPVSPIKVKTPLTPAKIKREAQSQVRFQFDKGAIASSIRGASDRVLNQPTFKRRGRPKGSARKGKDKTKKGKGNRNGKGKEKEIAIQKEREYAPLGDDGSTFFPSVCIGEHEEEGLSNIGRADKEVRQLEQIWREHLDHEPNLAPIVKRKLDEARERRAALDESLEENWRVGDVEPAASAIAKRIEDLEWGLSTSKFEPEANNIRCAIEAYKNGLIEYSDHMTIIYAGKVVDTALDYASLTRDRNERLDRYFEAHGPGWLWWEPPLDNPPESKPATFASISSIRGYRWDNCGFWYVNMGFMKRAGFVMRMPIMKAFDRPPHAARWTVAEDGSVDCQEMGAKMVFKCILDSGANWPVLYTEDLILLSINPHMYACQSVTTSYTIAGKVQSRVYELFVTIVDDRGLDLVDPNDPAEPGKVTLGSMTPVIQHTKPITTDENGKETVHRISGILPLLSCYVSVAPDNAFLHLGETRNDVLGSNRMPGGKSWSISTPRDKKKDEKAVAEKEMFGSPKILFSHWGGVITDQDAMDVNHANKVIVRRGFPDEEEIIINPAKKNPTKWFF